MFPHKKRTTVTVGGMTVVSQGDLQRIKLPLSLIAADLTFVVKDANYAGKSVTEDVDVRCYEELPGDKVALPREYAFKHVIPRFRESFGADNILIEWNATVGPEPRSWKFKAELDNSPKRNQKAAADALFEHSGILAAAPGKGKTVIAIAAAHRARRKALVIVPTNQLMDQWIERIVQHTDIDRYAIGQVKGKFCTYERAPIIIGMVQSLYSHEYPEGLYNSVGTLIVDECHRVAAPQFMRSVPRFPAITRWGLSATVDRKDGLHKAIMYHIGPVLYEMLQSDLKARVAQIETGIELGPRDYENRWNGQLNLSMLHTALSKVRRRNEWLARELSKAYASGRKILALSRRLEQIDVIEQMLISQYNVPANLIGKVTGETEKRKADKGRILQILETCRVILANEQIAGLGLDQEDIDTLFWLTPSQNVDQNVGRTTRDYPIHNKSKYVKGAKKEPLVIDPVDSFQIARTLAKSRLRRFHDLGFVTEHLDHTKRAE